MSDNEIKRLEVVSYLDRLTSLILCNNRISAISDLSFSLPKLENLFLLNNKVKDMAQI